jgi:hypothetical protein
VSTNGIISFGSGVSAFTPLSFSSPGVANISPFWADVDTRPACSSPVTVCISQDAASAETAAVTAAAQATGVQFTAVKSFAVTWPQVARYSQRCDLFNSFQAVLAVDANGKSLIIFNYGDLQWASGGVYELLYITATQCLLSYRCFAVHAMVSAELCTHCLSTVVVCVCARACRRLEWHSCSRWLLGSDPAL